MPNDKITNWSQAAHEARQRGDGKLVNVHTSTLKAMEKTGFAYQSDQGEWFLAVETAPVDVASGIPGALYVRNGDDLTTAGRPAESFAVQYYLGTTIDGRWDSKTGELVLSTPGEIFDLVARARPDGTMGLRLVNRKD